MSRSREVKYKCPYCGREFGITVYDSVETAKDADLRDACMSGDIFRHSCPHCHTDFMVQNPLVYIDAAHKFVIWLSSQDTGADLSALSGPLDAQGYKLRRCKTLKEFTEKIQIFEDGMDDVLVELAKYDSFIEYIDNKKGDPSSVTGVEYQRADNGVLKVNVRTDDRGMSFLIPVYMLEEEIETNKELYEVDNCQFPCVNDEWIISLFMESSGEA